jgi:hypothetical protein
LGGEPQIGFYSAYRAIIERFKSFAKREGSVMIHQLRRYPAMVKRFFPSLAFLAAILLAPAAVFPSNAATAEPAPARLSDQEFWKLASDYSEPDGTYRSENLVSNEIRFQTIIPALTRTATQGRAYVGVGSEQNFSYIVALRPSIAFIVDIRRGNLDLHLIYKALFEMSAGRADFVSRLFSRKTPKGLNASSTASEIFAAFQKATPDQALYEQNLKQIKSHLITKHGFGLSKGDLNGIDFVYSSWFKSGPDIQFELTVAVEESSGGSLGPGALAGVFPTYADLMTATDGAGKNRSYLATESAFEFVKDLESRNLIVPIIGNFAGPKALRSVGAWLKEHQAIVSIFYVSNVEQYLKEDGIWDKFCSNAAVLPIDGASTFIRSARSGFKGQRTVSGSGFELELVPMKPELASCAD